MTSRNFDQTATARLRPEQTEALLCISSKLDIAFSEALRRSLDRSIPVMAEEALALTDPYLAAKQSVADSAARLKAMSAGGAIEQT